MNGHPNPWMWLIAGPEGVGRTRFAMASVPAVTGSRHFVNLDEIARGLSPLAPDEARLTAARVALSRARDLIRQLQTFALETTLSGTVQARLAEEARMQGMKIGLLYFSVPSVETCLERVARRVSEGGHNVPEADVRQRFQRSAGRFSAYATRSDLWRVLNAERMPPRVAAEGRLAEVSFTDTELLSGLPVAALLET